MAYKLGGTSQEGFGFEKAIASFALRAVHESQGLISVTNVVNPTQGNTFEIPNFAPITWQEYNPAGTGGFTGDAVEQQPDLGQNAIVATPTVAATAFDIFYGWTTSFQLAATLGAEIGDSFAEKVDQRICAAFKSFKLTAGNVSYSASADGFTRVKELGAIELTTTGSVLKVIREAKEQFKRARISGNPVLVLDSNGTAGGDSSHTRLLAELTGGAVSQTGGSSLSALGDELLSTGMVTNIYGVTVLFSSFLAKEGTDLVGAYFDGNALYTVVKQMMEIKTGEKDGGLQAWLTGVAYMGAGVGDKRRGGAVLIKQD